MIKHYEKNTFANAAGYWTKPNLKLRRKLETIQPDISISRLVSRAYTAARAMKHVYGVPINAMIAAYLTRELCEALAATGQTTRHHLIEIGTYELPVQQKRGRKKTG